MSTPDPAPIHPPEEREAAPGSAPAGRRGRSLAEDLEDGPLRRELLGEPPAPPDLPPAPEPVFRARLVFDGTGSEYFRIWVVNSLLTLLTLGVYSAWAKVRKARWFAQHTSLLGDRFDYHGDPRRILLGRVLALGLLALWTFSFDIAPWLGFAVLGLLLVAGPVLFAGAQRFKLANTSWRGVRFSFDAPRREVYRVCVPALLVWTLGTVLSATDAPLGWQVGAFALLGLTLPWAHARLKRLQHAHAGFGSQGFSFEPAGAAFYDLYAKGLFLSILTLVVAMLGYEAANRILALEGRVWLPSDVKTIGLFLVLWIVVWPFFAARSQQIVWGRTRFSDGLGFAGHMRSSQLWKLAVGQTLLTLLTAGLYWPFAAVAIARYRVESVEVVGDRPLETVQVEAAPAGAGRASGDAAADLFGVDLGW